jgi:hypothetical protein
VINAMLCCDPAEFGFAYKVLTEQAPRSLAAGGLLFGLAFRSNFEENGFVLPIKNWVSMDENWLLPRKPEGTD